MVRERSTWYWISDPREGDIFAPLFINSDGSYYVDGEKLSLVSSVQTEELTWHKAQMPRDL